MDSKVLSGFPLIALIAAFLITLGFHAYYPKWNQSYSEATISWDVSGYYMYLPAIFIYKDLKKVEFLEEVLDKYKPTSVEMQTMPVANGNRVMKYSAGQSITMLPAFAIAHLWASSSDKYAADGFSFPYQFMISMGALLITSIGIFFLLKVLLIYFSVKVSGITLLAVVLGTNYLNYSAIDGAMTHNSLFTIYALLLYNTIKFYDNPDFKKAGFIGFLVGFAALIRPTEIITVLIPLLWGLDISKKKEIVDRFQFLKENSSKILLAIIVCGLMGSIQLIYWKYVSGDWLVYSYDDQGFDWLHPHLFQGILGFKTGWLVYSPLLFFAVFGFISLYRFRKSLFYPALIFMIIFTYITFSWSEWTYGGSLGARAMVQSYPVLMIPFASIIRWILKQRNWLKFLFFSIAGILCYVNIWFTIQAHRGGMLYVEQMTRRYYWKTLFTYKQDIQNLKLLDNKELFSGIRYDVSPVFQDNFISATPDSSCLGNKILKNAYCLKGNTLTYALLPSESEYEKFRDKEFHWLRASFDYSIENKEWNHWNMVALKVIYEYHGEIVKTSYIRVDRLVDPHSTTNVYFDTSKPKQDFDKVTIQIIGDYTDVPAGIQNVTVEVFDE